MTEEHRLIAGRYRLLERLGRGAMGVVWRGHDESLDRRIAVKELLPYGVFAAFGSPDPSAGEDAKRRVMREGRIAARLQHPNAVTVYNVVEDDGRPWLIMEYLPARSLADYLAAHGPLEPVEVLRLGEQLAAALTAAHAAGIVHRDVKPGNVLIAEDGTAKLTDFGISRTIGDGTVTATGDIAGTPAYFAPEVARGEQATFASDVFSLGATLYHAVEGAPPFGFGENQIALLYRVAGGVVEPPARAGAIAPVLQRLLRADPTARPDAGAAREALAAAVAGREPATVLAPAGGAPPVSPGRSRRRAPVALAGATVLVVAAALAIVLTSRGGTGDPTQAVAGARSGDTIQPPASAATGTASSSAPEPTLPSSTTSTSTPDSVGTPVQAVESYYALIPGDLRAGYARLTESFKQARSPSFATYRDFWQQWAEVRVSDVRSSGGNTVSATITYVSPDGGSQTERHVYTLRRTSDGWAIDGQRIR